MTPPTSTDRTLAAFRRLVTSFFPQLVYMFAHEYSVAESDGVTFSGIPTDPTFSPALPTRVPYAPSLAGSQCVVPSGTLAHVIFVNGDPAKPRCVGFDLGTGQASLPTSVTVDCYGNALIAPSGGAIIGAPSVPARLVREGDTYTATGSVPGAVVLVFAGTAQPSGSTTAKG